MAKKKLRISPKKTLIMSLSILTVCIVMLFVSIAVSKKEKQKTEVTKQVAEQNATKKDSKLEQERLSKLEAEKKAAEEATAAKQAAEQKAAQKAAKLEQERLAKLEAERKATEKAAAAKLEAERKAAEKAAKKEAEKSATKSSANNSSTNAKNTKSTSGTATKNSTATNATTAAKNTTTATTNATTAANATKSSDVAMGGKEKTETPPAKPGSKGTVFIIFDDGGNSLEELQHYLEIPFPVTISVLPSLSNSVETARRVRLAGKELMLHQPMQAKNLNINPGKNAILPSQSGEEMQAVFRKNLAEIGPVAGVNNHEGSLITENAWASGLILDICREQGIYFLDSRTTSETQVPLAAKERGMKIYERDVFIDDSNKKEDMIAQINRGLKIAEKKGYVIMIGHVRSHGLAKILTDGYPEWVKQGYAFSTLTKSGSIIK